MDKFLNFVRSFSNSDADRDEICYDKDAQYIFVIFGASVRPFFCLLIKNKFKAEILHQIFISRAI